MRHPLRLALIALALTPCLMACSQTVPVAVTPHVPAELFACAAEPVAGDFTSDAELWDWVVDLAYAGRDCRDKLAGIKAVVSP